MPPKAKKKGRKPAHMNTFAFTHNANSKLTKKILESPNEGLCKRCHDKIEWRKKYRKYKPLKQPAVCVYCKQKTVKAAYHKACRTCASQTSVCPWCLNKWSDIYANMPASKKTGEDEEQEEEEEADQDVNAMDNEVSAAAAEEEEEDYDDDLANDSLPGASSNTAENTDEVLSLLELTGLDAATWESLAQAGRIGLEVQEPYAENIINGTKTVETRSYPLPSPLFGLPLWILQSQKVQHEEQTSSAFPDHLVAVGNGDQHTGAVQLIQAQNPAAPELAQSTISPPPSSDSKSLCIVPRGTATFMVNRPYKSAEDFLVEEPLHLVASDSPFAWTEARPVTGWAVSGVNKVDPSELPELKGMTRIYRSFFRLDWD